MFDVYVVGLYKSFVCAHGHVRYAPAYTGWGAERVREIIQGYTLVCRH